MSRYRRPRICIFAGPTIARAELEAACTEIDARVEVRPPVQQGDLLRLLADLPDMIGIIDGYFFQVPAVLHKEIMLVMEQGVRVLGASSLGALRAAELDTLGMEGVGAIYRLYRDGVIAGDDEVAVLHASEADGFRQLTEPLVTIRHNLQRARARRIISRKTAAGVLASARRLHFTQRSYEAVLQETRDRGIVPGDELAALRRFLGEEAVDLKRHDALLLVERLKEHVACGTLPAREAPATVPRTLFLHLYERQYRSATMADTPVPEAQVLSLYKLLSPSAPRLVRRVALRCLAREEALQRGLVAGSRETLVPAFWRAGNLHTVEAQREWLRAQSLSDGDLVVGLQDRDLEAQVLALEGESQPDAMLRRAAAYRRIVNLLLERTALSERELSRPPLMRPGIPWEPPLLREIKLRGRFQAALDVTSQVQQYSSSFSRQLPGFELALAPGRLQSWFAQRWGVHDAAFPAAAADRGFTSYAEFLSAARLAYAFDHARAGRT
jgi:hypothetical protein